MPLLWKDLILRMVVPIQTQLDKYENNGSQKIKGKSFKLSSLFIAVAVFAIFIALGFFILKYYNNTVSRIYSGTSGASKTAASFQALADTNSED